MIEKSKLRIIFHDVLQGYSETKFRNIYVKHLNSFDAADVDVKYEKYLFEATKKGILTQKEKEVFLDKEGIWSSQQERKLQENKKYLEGLNITKSKLWRGADINRIKAEISKAEGKINDAEIEKSIHLDLTAEKYASNKVNEYYIYNAIYKDADLREKFFTWDEFNELDDNELGPIVTAYNECTSVFTEHNLKAVSLSPFFTNLFYLSEDDAFHFYGKPIVQLTFYQAQLYAYGRYFKNMLSDEKSRPPEEILEDPEKVIEWFTSATNGNALASKTDGQENVAVSHVGATKEDLRRMGVDTSATIDLVKEAAKKGGKLSMQDLMKIQGNK